MVHSRSCRVLLTTVNVGLIAVVFLHGRFGIPSTEIFLGIMPVGTARGIQPLRAFAPQPRVIGLACLASFSSTARAARGS